VRGVLELRSQRRQKLLDRLVQREASTADARLVHGDLLEVANQVGGARGVPFEQVDGLATAADEDVHLRAAQRTGSELRGECAQVLAERAGDDTGVAERCVEFVRNTGDEVPERGQLFGLHELAHRLAQFVRPFGDEFLELFAVALQLGFLALANSASWRLRSVTSMSAPTVRNFRRASPCPTKVVCERVTIQRTSPFRCTMRCSTS